MRKIDYLNLAGFLLMIFYNLFLNYKIIIIKNDSKIKKDTIYEFRQIIINNSSITGTKLDITAIQPGNEFRIIYRFTDSCCFDCVQEGLVLLENTFKDKLVENLLIVGSQNVFNHFEKYNKIIKTDELLEIDKFKDPYVCFINPEGIVLFSLLLKPKNYQINKEFLTYLSKNLTLKLNPHSSKTATQ